MSLKFLPIPGERLGLHAPMTPTERAKKIARPFLDHFGLEWADIAGPSRKKAVSQCRARIIRALCSTVDDQKRPVWSQSQVARMLRKNHTTIGYALRKPEDGGA